MLKKGDKVVNTKNYHLKRDENMPKELTNFWKNELMAKNFIFLLLVFL